MARPLKLTAKLRSKVCNLVRSGAFDHVAAGACGIGTSTFYRWMAEGRTAKAGPKREFWEEVSQARAEVRSTVEIAVRKAHPTFWLRNGPGKTRKNSPGWTDPMGEAPVDGETGETLPFDDAALLTKLDGIRERVTVETKKKKGKKKPRPKPRPRPRPTAAP